MLSGTQYTDYTHGNSYNLLQSFLVYRFHYHCAKSEVGVGVCVGFLRLFSEINVILNLEAYFLSNTNFTLINYATINDKFYGVQYFF